MRYWWQELPKDVWYIVSSCHNCNKSKGSCDGTELNPWFTSEPGELVFYDFAGPYFNKVYLMVTLDEYTGKIKLVVTTAADAIVVCEVLLGKWIPEQGFPLQLACDVGTSNLNDLVQILYELSGIQGLYATERRHQSIGKVENAIKQVNQHFRSMNIALDGAITDQDDRERAISKIRTYISSVEFHMNSTIAIATGFSPNMLDKGRQLRGIEDVKASLALLKKKIKNGLKKEDQVAYLQDLQDRIIMYRNIKDEKALTYILRNINHHNRDLARRHKYKPGEFVGYYVGDQNNNTQKWQARYKQCIFMENVNKGQAKIKDMSTGKPMIISKGMLKPYTAVDSQWMKEVDYLKYAKERDAALGKKKIVEFSE